MSPDTVTVIVFMKNSLMRCCMVLILAASAAAGNADDWVMARWVADGDTIVLQDNRHVRYIGIDTPEIDPVNPQAAPMGNAARLINRQLVEGWRLQLVYDREKTDRYGRTLAYVYRRDGLFVNAELLKKGFANVLPTFPNVSQEDYLLAVQREAMQRGRGIWQMVDKDARPAHAYLGNRRSKRFHAHDCPMGKKMSAKNRLVLENEWVAFWFGYSPAKECIEFPPRQVRFGRPAINSAESEKGRQPPFSDRD
jgi:micrococcal nuclease